jgi:uncharacterized YigZ family protein
MHADSFHTIKNASEGFFSDKGSKFISFAFPVKSEEEVKDQIQSLKKKYHDARHHVYGFIIGPNQEFYRASDDGEPANSSGMPVLGQIRSFGLTNVLIVVVRYFGGTKLGIPGLINAYRTAAKNALENAEIVEETVKSVFVVEFGYDEMNFVMKCLKDFDVVIKVQEFAESCRIVFAIRLSLSEDIQVALSHNHKVKTIANYE